MQADTIVADAETILGRVDTLEAFGVTGSGGGEAFEALFDTAGDAIGAIDERDCAVMTKVEGGLFELVNQQRKMRATEHHRVELFAAGLAD